MATYNKELGVLEYSFAEMVREILSDDILFEDEKIYELNELAFCVKDDELLVCAESWSGKKPEHDIELLGEHWYKSWQLEKK